MKIRELELGDLAALMELYAHLHPADAPLPEKSHMEAVWAGILRSTAFQYFGVFVDRRLVASCTLSVIPNLTRGCRPYGLIENVVTHTGYRRMGFGKAVLTRALDAAWARNCYKVMLMTGRKNEATYRFYESSGFDRDAKQAFLAKPPK